MLINKYYEKIKRIENGDYVLDEIITDEDLVIDLDDRLVVEAGIKAKRITSNVSIKAGSSIEAGNSIEARGYIKAGSSIEAEGYIKAGSYIEVEGYIEAGRGINAMLYIQAGKHISTNLRVFAGICDWREISEEEKTITCTELNGRIGYGTLNIIEKVKEMTTEEAEKELSEKYECKVKIKNRI